MTTRYPGIDDRVTRKDVLGALDRLAAKEILVEKNERYSFPVNLLRKWISARWPLRKVRGKPGGASRDYACPSVFMS